MSQWICKNGHTFIWQRQGNMTTPGKCPICNSDELDVREV